MPIDESHGQNNAVLKVGDGAIGVPENPAALCGWMISGPEMAQFTEDFLQTVKAPIFDSIVSGLLKLIRN